jgi:hypothetical protein
VDLVYRVFCNYPQISLQPNLRLINDSLTEMQGTAIKPHFANIIIPIPS